MWAIGLIFSLPIVSYIIMGPFLLIRLTKKFEMRTTIHIGFFLMFVASILCGPSEVLGFPDKLYITCIGLGFIGAGAAMTVIPVIPEML